MPCRISVQRCSLLKKDRLDQKLILQNMVVQAWLNVHKFVESVLIRDEKLPALRLDLSILPDPDRVLVGTLLVGDEGAPVHQHLPRLSAGPGAYFRRTLLRRIVLLLSERRPLPFSTWRI